MVLKKNINMIQNKSVNRRIKKSEHTNFKIVCSDFIGQLPKGEYLW